MQAPPQAHWHTTHTTQLALAAGHSPSSLKFRATDFSSPHAALLQHHCCCCCDGGCCCCGGRGGGCPSRCSLPWCPPTPGRVRARSEGAGWCTCAAPGYPACWGWGMHLCPSFAAERCWCLAKPLHTATLYLPRPARARAWPAPRACPPPRARAALWGAGPPPQAGRAPPPRCAGAPSPAPWGRGRPVGPPLPAACWEHCVRAVGAALQGPCSSSLEAPWASCLPTCSTNAGSRSRPSMLGGTGSCWLSAPRALARTPR